MAKHSKHERAQRARETERTKEIQAAWYASMPADVAKAFSRDVAEARARGPLPPPPDQAPGTAPNPPRVVKESKSEDRPRRRY